MRHARSWGCSGETRTALALTCSGEGEPAVILLHGLISSSDDASRAHEPVLRSHVHRAYALARRALPTIPGVPGTMFVRVDKAADPEASRFAVRAQQATLIARFSPGRTITVDTPDAMARGVPELVSTATLEIVEQAR